MKILRIVFVLILVGCSSETFVTSMGDENLHQLATDAFDNAGIWYKQLSGSRFEFKLKDKRKVESIIGRLYQKMVPSNRSVSFGPEMEAIVLRKFSENSIKYDVRQFQGDRWVVWSETDASKAEVLVSEAKKELIIELQSGLSH